MRRSERANKGRRPTSEYFSPGILPRPGQAITDLDEETVVVNIDHDLEEDQIFEETEGTEDDLDKMAPHTRLKYSRFKGDGSQDVNDWFCEFESITVANQEDPASK